MGFFRTFQDLKDFAKEVHFYEHDAWMGEYDMNDIGEYLRYLYDNPGPVYNVIKPTRLDFILWKTRNKLKEL